MPDSVDVDGILVAVGSFVVAVVDFVVDLLNVDFVRLNFHLIACVSRRSKHHFVDDVAYFVYAVDAADVVGHVATHVVRDVAGNVVVHAAGNVAENAAIDAVVVSAENAVVVVDAAEDVVAVGVVAVGAIIVLKYEVLVLRKFKYQ